MTIANTNKQASKQIKHHAGRSHSSSLAIVGRSDRLFLPAGMARANRHGRGKGYEMYLTSNISSSDAVKNGSTKSGEIRIEITQEWLDSLSIEERNVLSQLPGLNGQKSYIESHHGSYNGSLTRLPAPTLDAILVFIRDKIDWMAEKAKKQAEENAKRQAQAIKSLESRRTYKKSEYVDGDNRIYLSPDVCISDLPDDRKEEAKKWKAELDEKWQAEKAEIIAAAENRKKAEREAKEKEAIEKREQYRRYKKACIELLQIIGTESQQARHKLGKLPADELDKLVHDYVFAPLEDMDRYEKLTDDDVEHDRDCYDPDISYDVWDSENWTDEHYKIVSECQKLMPGATIKIRIHQGLCACDGETIRHSLHVSQEWNGENLTREYAI